MNYEEFEKIAEQIGDGGKCEVSIFGTEIKNAMLSKQDSEDGTYENAWFILQNEMDGIEGLDTRGYEYSWVIDDETAYTISYIRPVSSQKKTKSLKPTWGVSVDGEVRLVGSIEERDKVIAELIHTKSVSTFRITSYYKVLPTNNFTLEEVK